MFSQHSLIVCQVKILYAYTSLVNKINHIGPSNNIIKIPRRSFPSTSRNFIIRTYSILSTGLIDLPSSTIKDMILMNYWYIYPYWTLSNNFISTLTYFSVNKMSYGSNLNASFSLIFTPPYFFNKLLNVTYFLSIKAKRAAS